MARLNGGFYFFYTKSVILFAIVAKKNYICILTLNNKTMKFEFAKATDITDFARSHYSEYEIYEKIFITTDVNDFHIHRVLINRGHDYKVHEGSFLTEWNKIGKEKREKINSINKLKKILSKDSDLENWDYWVNSSLSDALEVIDGGYGINL